MEDLKVFDTKDLVSLQLGSTSKGNQEKWVEPNSGLWIKEQFYYQGKFWKDYLVEALASTIAEQMDLFGVPVLKQSICEIRSGSKQTIGVYSQDFCKDANYISFNRILENSRGEVDFQMSAEERWNYLISVIMSYFDVDYTEYLTVMTLIDIIVGNEDRHLSNFGIMENGKLAPIFDFGLGLFEHDRCYEGVPFNRCLGMMHFKPLSPDVQVATDFIKDRVKVERYFPKGLDLTEVELPSAKAGSYLRNRFSALGISLKGVV